MVSLSEFAREVGRDKALISRLIKRGVIPRYDNGMIPLAEGLAAFNAYDKAPKNKGGRGNKTEQGKENIIPIEQPSESVEFTEAENSARKINAAINKAKLADKTFQARLRELEYKLRSGELLKKDEVEAEAQQLAEQIKSKLMAIPPRISSICEGRPSREIEEIITDAINNALEELQKYEYKSE